MRIAVFANNIDERYLLSRLAEEELLKRGILPEVSLFPMLGELVDASKDKGGTFDLAIVKDEQETALLRHLCTCLPVILIGNREDGPVAFDIGVRYLVECPVDKSNFNRALTRCLSHVVNERQPQQ